MQNRKCIGLLGLAALVLFLLPAGCEMLDNVKSYTVTITFSTGEGGGTPPPTMSDNENATFTLPGQGNMTAPEGKIFWGWNMNDGGMRDVYGENEPYQPFVRSSDYTITAVAVWGSRISATFDPGEGGGTPPDPIILDEYGEFLTITLPGQGDMTAPEGKGFQGWRSSLSSNLYQAGKSTVISSDLTFTAVWAGRISAAFDLGEGGGTPPAPIIADEYGLSFTIPSLPGQGDMTAPEGKNFRGWKDLSLEASSVHEADASVTISGDTTFTAQWTDKTIYLVTFSMGSSSGTPPESMRIESGTAVTLPDITAWGSRGFQGWRSSSNYSLYQAGASVTIIADTTFTALWGNTISITFGLGGGSGTPPESMYVEQSSDSITLPDQGDMIAPNGQYFGGWYRGGSGTVLKAGESVTNFTSATTFTAVWNDYRVITFSLGDVSGTPPESMTVESGTTITLPTVDVPEGKIFRGWQSSSNYSLYQAGASVTITAITTFTAQWTNKISITFDLGGGSGTPPELIYVEKSSDSITLPDQGDMIAPNGKYFGGWYRNLYGGTVFKVGESVTNFNSATNTFTAVWNDYRVITFSLGEVSGTPPGEMMVESGTTISLPETGVTVPEGKIFQGWRSTNYLSGKYDFSVGESVTITASNTFTARWANKKYAQEGIYISLISFAGNATILRPSYPNVNDDFVFLDSTGKDNLSSILTSRYNKAGAPGTALFYGVHKGLANLTANEGEFLTDISSVNLITFTDGLDNGSFGASNSNPIEGKSGVTRDAYAAYVKEEIGSRKINGKPITAYSVGVKGSDVEDEAQFAANLGSIASTQDKVREITNFSELGQVFTDIADTLSFTNHFSVTTTQNDPGTIVRMTFDVTGTSSADAATSSKYLEGVLGYSDGVWTLTNVTYEGITSDVAAQATIIGTVSGSNVRFLFRNISGYDPATAKVQQWTKTSAGSANWQRNSEYSATGSTSTSPVLIQLVLDASTSLSDSQIGQIRTAVNSFITTLYNRVSSNSN